jgi:signal transduction histidine kinase
MRMGNCLVNMQKKDSAISFYFTALKFFELSGISERIATCSDNIAGYYRGISNWDKSKYYYEKAINLFKDLKDTVRIATSLNSFGLLETEAGKYKEAILLHNDILKRYSKSIDAELHFYQYYNIAYNFTFLQNDSAVYYYKKAENIAIELKDSILLSKLYNNVGDVYYSKKNYPVALSKYLLALNHSDTDSATLSIIYENLSNTYSALGNTKNAYSFLQKSFKINEYNFDKEKSKIATELSEKYESDKKDVTIKNQLSENKLKSRNFLLSLIGLVLFASFTFIIFKLYRKKQKANIILNQQYLKVEELNAHLYESNQTKARLFSVISHDLRAPISSLYAFLQMKDQENSAMQNKYSNQVISQTEELLNTLENLLVWSKSQLKQFSLQYVRFDLRKLFMEINDLIQHNLLQKNISISIESPLLLPISTDYNILSIILRNVMINALQNAPDNSEIKTIIKQSNQKTFIQVTNETLVSSTILKSSTVDLNKGLGLIIIKEFSEKINASIEISQSNNSFSISIIVPNTI